MPEALHFPNRRHTFTPCS